MTKQMLGYDVNLPYGHYHQKKEVCVRARFSYLLRLRDFYSILCVLIMLGALGFEMYPFRFCFGFIRILLEMLYIIH